MARANPTNLTLIPTRLTTKAKVVRKLVVESHLVVVDVERESLPLKQEKNGLTKNKYKTYSGMAKKNCTGEASVGQTPTLRLTGKTLNP